MTNSQIVRRHLTNEGTEEEEGLHVYPRQKLPPPATRDRPQFHYTPLRSESEVNIVFGSD